MLGGAKLKVTYTHEKTCFVYISPKYSSNNEKPQCVQVLHRDKNLLLWLVYSSSVPEGHIACNPIFSRLLGLVEGVEVFASPYGEAKVLEELYIDTDSPDDQEILEHNVELLQLRILDQLRIVVSNQKSVVWISASLPIVFTPKQTGLLVTHSRIIVKVDAFNSFHTAPVTPVVPKTEDGSFKNIGIINNGLLKPYLNASNRLVLRALPIDSDGKKNLIHPYIVFMHEDLLDDKFKHSTVVLATMQNIPPMLKIDENAENEIEQDTKNKADSLCVEIVLVDSIVFRSLCQEVYNKNIQTVLIPKALNAICNIENGTRIIFTLIGDKVDQPDHIDIITYSEQPQTESDIIEKFKDSVIDNTHSGKKFLINDGVVKQNTQICKGFLQLKLKPDKLKYTMLNSESFRHCTVAAKCLTDCDLHIPKMPLSNLDYDLKNYCRTMKPMEDLVNNIISHLYFEIHRDATFKNVSEIKSNILITGGSGSGKSSVCALAACVARLRWSRVSCRSWRGRREAGAALRRALADARRCRPAALLLDDIDALLPPHSDNASPLDIAYYQRLAVTVKQLLQTCTGVCVVMTAESVKSLHPLLRQFTGKPLFTAHFEIPQLDQEARVCLFKHLVNDKVREEFLVEEDDLVRMASDTAGASVRDLTDYINRKIFKAVKKKKANPELKPRLVEDITKDVEKANAYDVWGSIGGLDDVKQSLSECIFWPLMYPSLFPSAGCGVLLYGVPGTGKSALGASLARATGLALLVVKGPELLSKYIGQSEKAVRDVFDKAEMKRPCVLFFDEFDSIAPKRGHDSTGVTDRVVNQLLARLDGAEGGARGPVVAATARPDLLDPALLRPGRLATHLHCALPAQKDRFEILKVLVKDVTVDEKVDLEAIAEKTDGFSPADLKSLLITAQLGRLETQLINSEDKNMETVVVRQEDIDAALKETKPSLSPEQRLFYDTIYKRFRGETLSPEHRLMAMQMQKQRVTLA